MWVALAMVHSSLENSTSCASTRILASRQHSQLPSPIQALRRGPTTVQQGGDSPSTEHSDADQASQDEHCASSSGQKSVMQSFAPATAGRVESLELLAETA